MFSSLLSKKNKIPQKRKVVLNVALSTCAILIILSGMAFAADRSVIVGFKKPVGQEEDNIIASHGGLAKKNFHVINAVTATVPDNRISELKNDPRVDYVEDEHIYKASDEYTNSWGVQRIGSQPVHNQNINGTGVKIAILDTGIDYNHIDLKDNYKGGYNFVYNNANPMDDNTGLYGSSHGTHVSGIIGAENNGIGVVGVAPNASLYAVKVLGGDGSSTTSLIISGIQWAIDNKMDIVSMSFGSADFDQALQDACDAAYNAGILLVASAGNTGGPVTYPAGFNSVIAVTATDALDQNATFSPNDSKIELAAPGVNINSTCAISPYQCAGGYRILSGTSQAAPHVTGVAALIYSTNFPDVNNDGVKNNKDVRLILDNTAKDLGIAGRDTIYGYGIVDASNATLGISAYPGSIGSEADLSVTKDDGVSEVIAGDGNTYAYTITIKNNGPSDASNVKVSDIWPAGFTRGTVITSSGTCDTATSSTSFTCDLGNIAKDGTATVAVKYTVSSDTLPGNYTNRAEVSSTTKDPNPNNNVAEDKNIVYIRLTLVRTRGLPIEDAKNVSLSQGNYSIEIKNINLSILQKIVSENGNIQLNQSSIYKFNGPEEPIELLYIKNMVEVDFIPYGQEKSVAYVTIRRLS